MITAEEEFKRNPDLKQEDLKHIKEWLSKQIHLPQNVPDVTLILLMHSCYYSVEQTKQTIDHYFTMRTHLPEFFDNRDLSRPEMQEVCETLSMVPLEGRTKEGYKVLLIAIKRTDPQFFNFNNAFKLYNMVAEASFQVDGTWPGFVTVVDFTGARLGHMARCTIPAIKKMMMYFQEGMPVRLKGLHYINIVSFMDKVMALLKPFIKKELMELLFLHTEGSGTIYDFVPKHLFPKEYGGAGGSIEDLTAKARALMLGQQDWYRRDDLMRVDENKRPGKAKSAGDLFGVDGSFRRLSID